MTYEHNHFIYIYGTVHSYSIPVLTYRALDPELGSKALGNYRNAVRTYRSTIILIIFVSLLYIILFDSDIVHCFGREGNPTVAETGMKELILLVFDKKLKFIPAERGKATFQNFACYSKGDGRYRGDETKVRKALVLINKTLEEHQERHRYKAGLLSMRPLDVSAIVSWNESRQEAASAIEACLMYSVEVEEANIIAQYNKIEGKDKKLKPPTTMLPTVGKVLARCDKIDNMKTNLTLSKSEKFLAGFLKQQTSTDPEISSDPMTAAKSKPRATSDPKPSKQPVKSLKPKPPAPSHNFFDPKPSSSSSSS